MALIKVRNKEGGAENGSVDEEKGGRRGKASPQSECGE